MTYHTNSPTLSEISRVGRRVRLLAFLIAMTATACGGNDAPAAESGGETATAHKGEREQAMQVQLDTAAVHLGDIRLGEAAAITSTALPVTGSITYDANRVSHIGARTSGRVVSMRADLGARVRAGQVLAILESPEVGQIRAAERESEELVGIALENYARERRLEQQGISSRKELLNAEAELRRAEASQRSAEERLRVLGAGHGVGGEFAVVSPFGGAVVARDVSLGEMAEPSDTLFTVADLSRVWIELDVFERNLERVRPGQQVQVTTDAYPNRSFPGHIVYVADVLDPVKRTARARVEIPNPGKLLKPGMFARANIAVQGGPSLAVVPQEAVQELEGKTVVFVPGPGVGSFRATPVTVGERLDGGRVVIRSGLQPGARVVVRGAFSLRSELAKGEIGDEH